ncbi:septum formation initiator family protein, partial [Micrococcus luteus]|nr:septum formation initiator family protein [Micrococcus luteus]
MSPRRPRVPRVDPTTGAPRRTAVAAPATASPEADAPTPTPAAPTSNTPPTGAEVIDLQRVQERRAGHPGHPDADRADTA